MFKPKPDKPAKRLVWRMSASNLAGEFVLPSARRVDPAVGAGPAEVHERWFQASSMELIEGSEVSETDLDTLPGELVDVFLGVRR